MAVDAVAYVLSEKKSDDHGMSDVTGTIPVLPAGWSDLNEIREEVGERGVSGGAANRQHSDCHAHQVISYCKFMLIIIIWNHSDKLSIRRVQEVLPRLLRVRGIH